METEEPKKSKQEFLVHNAAEYLCDFEGNEEEIEAMLNLLYAIAYREGWSQGYDDGNADSKQDETEEPK